MRNKLRYLNCKKYNNNGTTKFIIAILKLAFYPFDLCCDVTHAIGGIDSFEIRPYCFQVYSLWTPLIHLFRLWSIA